MQSLWLQTSAILDDNTVSDVITFSDVNLNDDVMTYTTSV